MNTSIQLKLLPIAYLLTLISLPISYASPIRGFVSNDLPLCKQSAVPDKRCPLLKGHVKQTKLKGLIGIRYEYETGRITYIYPESDINRFGVKVGDYVLKIEIERFRPCLMPLISFYPKDYILNLTIKDRFGKIRVLPVKLIDARNIIGS